MEQHRAAAPWLIVAAIILALFLIAFFTIQTPAMAQQLCAPYATAAEVHANAGQVETSVGIISDSVALVLFTSPGGETWALVTVDLNGKACLIAQGNDWLQGEVRRAPVEGERAS